MPKCQLTKNHIVFGQTEAWSRSRFHDDISIHAHFGYCQRDTCDDYTLLGIVRTMNLVLNAIDLNIFYSEEMDWARHTMQQCPLNAIVTMVYVL